MTQTSHGVKILHTNDFHGHLPKHFESLKILRANADIFLDSGDVVEFGNLAIPLKEDPAWQLLNDLHCTASTLGNRESHFRQELLFAKLKGASHPILCANLQDREGNFPLARTLKIELDGVKIGVFGVMIQMTTREMALSGLSTYLWSNPFEAAADCVEELRSDSDFIFALTHLGFKRDLELVQKVPGIDVVFGGHSHSVLTSPELHDQTWIVQGGSHGKWAGMYKWDGDQPVEKRLTGELVPL